MSTDKLARPPTVQRSWTVSRAHSFRKGETLGGLPIKGPLLKIGSAGWMRDGGSRNHQLVHSIRGSVEVKVPRPTPV